jgi:hypothetical protein
MEPTASPVPLEVFLNDGRSYVQGTQMLGRAAELVLAEHPAASLKSAAFHRITDKLVSASVLAPGTKPAEDALGSAEFHTGDATCQIAFIEGADIAPPDVVPPACTYTPTGAAQDSPLSADYRLGSVRSFEDMMVALIQTIKKQHDALPGEIRDIWFTGLRGSAIPAPFSAPEGLLEIRFMRLMGKDGAYQSLQKVTYTPEGAEALFSGAITFAFKSETPPDVA